MRRSVAAWLLALLVPAQAWAGATSASLIGYGLDLGHGYGLSDSDVAGGTASVESSGFSAPFGSAGPWGPANTTYPIVYSGAAAAVGSTGELHASIKAQQFAGNTPFRFGVATASSDGSFMISGSSAGQLALDIAVDIDGVLKGDSSFAIDVYVASLTDPTHFWRLQKSESNTAAVTDVNRRYSMSITGVDGEQFRLLQKLTASASTQAGIGSADFFNTSVLRFLPGTGVSVSGVDGYLVAAPGATTAQAVPEPGVSYLIAAGLATLVVQRRRTVRVR